MTTQLTRAELHKLVWETPMTKLAKRYGVSDVALHKICRKHSIPTPPQGHWAKIQHGKAVTHVALPTDKASGTADSVIMIYGGSSSTETEPVLRARTEALERVSGGSSKAIEPHPIIGRTLAQLERGKIDRLGLAHTKGKLITASMQPASIPRAKRILEKLHRTAATAGMDLIVRSDNVVWDVAGETVSFEICERAEKYEHVATEAELRAVGLWEEKRAETHRRYGYLSDYGRPHIPKWEERYEGRLSIRLEEVRVQTDQIRWGDAITRTFSDTKKRDVLDSIPRIVSTLAAIAAAKRENRNVEARRRTAEEEARRIRIERERQAAIEKDRGTLFEQLHQAHLEVQRLSAYLAVLAQPLSPVEQPHLDHYRQWLTERRDRMAAALTAASLEQRLAKSGLFAFPDTTDGLSISVRGSASG